MNVSASLIVTIVRKGWGSSVLQASVKAGARGGTVLLGRGAGVHEREKIFGMSIEPEKEIVLTIVQSEQVEAILGEIMRAAELNAAGHGMAFVVPAPGKTFTPADVIAWCRENMANYKVPRRVEIVDALPMNASGKVLKFELRTRAAQLTGSAAPR